MGGELLESLSRGRGRFRHFSAEPTSLGPQAVEGARWTAVDGGGSAGVPAARCRPGGQSGGGGPRRPGGGWSGGCVTGARPAAGARAPVQVRTGGARLAAQGGGALRRQAQRQRRGPGALFLEQRQALRGRGQQRGGERGHSSAAKVGGREARRGDARGHLGCRGGGGGGGRGGPSPEHPPPGPRGSRPRSPRPPPSQTPASSRPGSPGNH